jgi:hypothetical protein
VQSFTPRPLYPGERAPGTHWLGGWVEPRAGLDDVEESKFLTLPGLELRPIGRPARSQSLYRLHYPGLLLLLLLLLLHMYDIITCNFSPSEHELHGTNNGRC